MKNKFDLFEGMNEEGEDFRTYSEESTPDMLDEIPDVNQDDEPKTRKRGVGSVSYRSKEEYESLIIDTYSETFYHPESGEPYEVLVKVFQPEENPFDNLKPAFAFSTNH